MKNRIADLNNALFAQLERLGDENLTGEDLDQEVRRAQATCGVADRIIENHRTVTEVIKAASAAGIEVTQTPLLEYLGEPGSRGGVDDA